MTSIPLHKKSFQKIIQFYLFECPVRTRERIPKRDRNPNDPREKYKYRYKRVSKRGKSFEERALDGAKLNTLRAAMKRVADITMVATDDQVMAPDYGEYIIIKRNEQSVSITEGFFYCIRNALAHGDFDVNKDVYELRNRTGDIYKGVARLKEETLLKWIDLVDMSPEELKKVGK